MSTASDAIRLADEAATRRAGRDLAASLAPGAVVALVGPLGAGKTTFVKGIAEGLGIDPDRVTSPTFVLMQVHRGGARPLVHIDAFRIGTAEFEALDPFADPGAIVTVEWADRVRAALPDGAVWLVLEAVAGGGRVLRRAGDD